MKTAVREYQTSYGILRILACLLVIIHHFAGTIQDANVHTQMLALDNLAMVNNGLFFMLSGKYALEHFDGKISTYYKKRFVKIVVPYLIISCLLDMINGHSVLQYAKSLLKGEISNWFVYAVIGFYLVAPFLYYLFKDASDRYKGMFLLLLILYVVMDSVNNCIEPFFYTGDNPFFGNLTFFILGYLVDNIQKLRAYKPQILFVGILAAIVSTYEITVCPGWNPNIYGLCVTRVCMCIAVYVFICWCKPKHINDGIRKWIQYFAGLTYYVYLVHGEIQNHAIYHAYKICKAPFGRLVLGSLEVLILSFLLAFFYQTAEKGLKKIVHRYPYKRAS